MAWSRQTWATWMASQASPHEDHETLHCAGSHVPLHCAGSYGSLHCAGSYGSLLCAGSHALFLWAGSYGLLLCAGSHGLFLWAGSYPSLLCAGSYGLLLCAGSYGSLQGAGSPRSRHRRRLPRVASSEWPGRSRLRIVSIHMLSYSAASAASSPFSPHKRATRRAALPSLTLVGAQLPVFTALCNLTNVQLYERAHYRRETQTHATQSRNARGHRPRHALTPHRPTWPIRTSQWRRPI